LRLGEQKYEGDMKRDNEGKVLLITGAGRGMGTDIAKAALALGYRTAATGRNVEKVREAVGISTFDWQDKRELGG
jgi:NAD(P)-dependent dehydrogenase (short-subunit alcohol dehydrogenase family)